MERWTWTEVTKPPRTSRIAEANNATKLEYLTFSQGQQYFGTSEDIKIYE